MKRVEYWAARLVLAGAPWLPVNWRVTLYAHLLDLAVPRLRRVALRNLELAGFDDSEKIVSGVFRSIARIVVTFAQFPDITRENVHRWIRYDGLENFTTAQARGRGVLVATGHLGNWELSAYTHALMTGPMNIVVRPLDNPRVDALVEQRRGALGQSHHPQEGSCPRDSARAQSGRCGGDFDRSKFVARGRRVHRLLRRESLRQCGLREVRASHGSAVVPGFALWSEAEQRYILTLLSGNPHDRRRSIDTQRVHTALEQVIREYPDQWLWIHRRWKTRPPGEPGLY